MSSDQTQPIPYPPLESFNNSGLGGSEAGKVIHEKNYLFYMRKMVCGGKEYLYGVADGKMLVKEFVSGEPVPAEGQFCYYYGLLYPRKGFPFPEALAAVNVFKRIGITAVSVLGRKELILSHLGFLILPWKYKQRIIQKAFDQLIHLAEPVLSPYYLKDNYHMKPALEVRACIKIYLEALGFDSFSSFGLGRIGSMIIEFDNLYCDEFQDIMSECSQSQLIKSPRRELKRLVSIYVSREKNPKLITNAQLISKILSLFLLMPRFKRAFVTMARAMNLDNLRLTEADQYHALFTDGYDFMGRSYRDRQIELARLHDGTIPQPIEVQGAPDKS